MRAVLALARADFLERVRRHSFLLTLGAAAWLGYGVHSGTVALRFGEYRGAPNSAWIGLQMALTTAAFVSLAGFWVVRGAVEQDRHTGVGQVLAATPLRRFPYVSGKLLSNFLVQGSMVGVLAVAALLMQLLAPGGAPVEPWPLFAPFLLLALPAMAGTAAFAVLFDCVPFLAGGLGNVIWFFFWGGFASVAAVGRVRWLDMVGFTLVEEQVVPFVRARFPGYGDGFALSGGPRREAVGQFLWPGMEWTAAILRDRLSWFLLAVGIAAVAAAFFDRFDSARASRAGAERDEEPRGFASAVPRMDLPAPLPACARAPRFPAVAAAELRLMLQGRRWWWWGVALGLLVAQAVTPLAEARHHALGLAWIWPVLLWSSMGVEGARLGTDALLFSSERSLSRQLPAHWAAGFAVALLSGSVAGLRLLATGDAAGVAAWLAGAAFVPALALALGEWSGTSKLFEALYTALWYVGPMQSAPPAPLDFLGAVPSHAAQSAGIFATAAVLLSGAAWAGRKRRMLR